MIWTRSDVLALAKQDCMKCSGLGILSFGKPCRCVFRQIFRICLRRYNRNEEVGISLRRLTPFRTEKTKLRNYGLRFSEYRADFCLLCRHHLSSDDYRILEYHYFRGYEQPQYQARFGLDKGDFFHAIHDIANTMGQVFRETRPYALFPIDEYFCERISI